MAVLQVELAERSYPVHVGARLDPSTDPALANARPIVVLTDANVATLHDDRIARLLEGRTGECIVVPAGEGAKSFARLEKVLERMAAVGATRSWALVAFGGGVVGDLGGLAASLFMRGIDVVQVPTTLLAQVDSAVGGKTAVNLSSGKNLAGAFWQPRSVWADVQLLATLPRDELANGFGEVAKHALLDGPEMVEDVIAAAPRLIAREAEALGDVTSRCLLVKIRHVVADEREAGVRALLNLGHTVGHAIEHATGLPHGIAVGLGLLAETRLGEVLGIAERGTAARVERLLEALELPLQAALPSSSQLVELMQRDKKRDRSAELTASLLVRPGSARVARDLPARAVLAVLDALRA